MTVIKGNGGSIIFRANDQGNYYTFTFTTNGLYSLFALKKSGGGTELLFGRTTAGKGITNLLAIMAQGHKIALFINKQYINSTEDAISSSRAIGLAGDRSSMQDSVDIAFSNLQIWRL